MCFLCGNLRVKKSFFELKQRLIVARVRYLMQIHNDLKHIMQLKGVLIFGCKSEVSPMAILDNFG